MVRDKTGATRARKADEGATTCARDPSNVVALQQRKKWPS